MKYYLEIIGPGDHNVYASFESDSPFMPISVGDLFDPRQFKDCPQGCRLKVVNVEHAVWESNGDPRHKVIVATREIPTDVAYQVEGE